MRFRWMPPAVIAGIFLLCASAAVFAQGYLGSPVQQVSSDQMSMLPQYRVQPMPSARYSQYPQYAPQVAPAVVAPTYQPYGSSFYGHSDPLPADPRLVPTPEPQGDRLSQLEAELATLKASMTHRNYGVQHGGVRNSLAPRHTGFYAGTAFVFARPSFTDASNYGIYDAPADHSTAGSFDYDYELAPRMWLGYVGRTGRGVRARYWQFDHAGRARSFTQDDPTVFYGADWIHPWGMITAMTTGVGDQMNLTNSLKAQTIDLEVTQALKLCWAEVTFAGGLRYARLEKQFNAVVPGVDFLIAHQDFEGIGPMIATDVRLPIDPCGCWALYGSGRYSIMFGSSWAYGENGTDPFDYTLDEVLSIGEIEIGVEWIRATKYLGLLTFRAGYEAQVWYEAGSPSNVAGDLGFEGLNFSVSFLR